ncbi:hypothetical protein IAQ61_005647 [Plenodomus lingam]|nr:hypothetical protein IAQ61_005647 [Plenodomus lingam]
MTMRSIVLHALILPTVSAGRLFADDAYLESAWEASTVANASPASLPRSDIPFQTITAEHENIELRQAPDVAANAAQPPVDPKAMPESPENAAKQVESSTDPALPAPGAAFPAPASSTSTELPPANPDPVDAALPATETSSPIPASKSPPEAAPMPAPLVAPLPSAASPIIAVVASASASAATTTPPSPTGVKGDDYISVQWVETWIGGTFSTWVPETWTVHFPSRTPGPAPGKGEIGLGTIEGQAGSTRTIYEGAAPTPAAVWARGVAAAVGMGVLGLVA